MKRFDFKIAIPRWVWGLGIGFLLAGAQTKGWVTGEQAVLIAGILSAWGVDVDAYRRAQDNDQG
jgi:hypothetical protein